MITKKYLSDIFIISSFIALMILIIGCESSEQKQIEKEVKATEKILQRGFGSSDLIINMQLPGNKITISSANIKSNGFIVIKGPNDKNSILGHSQILQAGKVSNLEITLTEYVDNVELRAELYIDDGDGIFDPSKDSRATDEKSGWVIYRSFFVGTKRSAVAYYSPTIKPGVFAIVMKEQLPGNKIKIDSVSVNKNSFIAVFKDSNGVPGKFIGQSNLLTRDGSGIEVPLGESVSNEQLYAVLYEDDGDSKFDTSKDTIAKAVEKFDISTGKLEKVDNLDVIVKFKVIS